MQVDQKGLSLRRGSGNMNDRLFEESCFNIDADIFDNNVLDDKIDKRDFSEYLKKWNNKIEELDNE